MRGSCYEPIASITLNHPQAYPPLQEESHSQYWGGYLDIPDISLLDILAPTSISPLTHHPHKPPRRRYPTPHPGQELKKPMKIVDREGCSRIAENCRNITTGSVKYPSSPLRSSAEIAETYDRTLTGQSRGAAKVARNIEELFR